MWRKDYPRDGTKATVRSHFLNTLFCIVIEAEFDLDKVPDVLRARDGLKSLREWREGFQNKEEWKENRQRANGIIHGESWREFRAAVLAVVEESAVAGLAAASLPSASGAVPLSIGLRPEREKEEEEGEEGRRTRQRIGSLRKRVLALDPAKSYGWCIFEYVDGTCVRITAGSFLVSGDVGKCLSEARRHLAPLMQGVDLCFIESWIARSTREEDKNELNHGFRSLAKELAYGAGVEWHKVNCSSWRKHIGVKVEKEMTQIQRKELYLPRVWRTLKRSEQPPAFDRRMHDAVDAIAVGLCGKISPSPNPTVPFMSPPRAKPVLLRRGRSPVEI